MKLLLMGLCLLGRFVVRGIDWAQTSRSHASWRQRDKSTVLTGRLSPAPVEKGHASTYFPASSPLDLFSFHRSNQCCHPASCEVGRLVMQINLHREVHATGDILGWCPGRRSGHLAPGISPLVSVLRVGMRRTGTGPFLLSTLVDEYVCYGQGSQYTRTVCRSVCGTRGTREKGKRDNGPSIAGLCAASSGE